MNQKNKVFCIVSMILMLSAVFWGTQSVGAAGMQKNTKTSGRKILNPWSLPEDLQIFLGNFEWYANGNDEYDIAGTPGEYNVMGEIFSHMVDFDSYPGPSAKNVTSGDPLGRFQDEYVLYDGAKTDWILKNIFHYTDENISDVRSIGEDTNRDYYYYNENYYVCAGNVGGSYECRPCYVEKADDKYYVVFACYTGTVEYYFNGLQYAEVSRYEENGEKYWSIEYWNRFLPEEDMTRDSEILGKYVGEWTCTEDDSSVLNMKLTESGELEFYTGIFRLLGFDAMGKVMKNGAWAVFGGVDGSNFYGCLEYKEDSLLLHMMSLEESMGNMMWNGEFKELFTRTFTKSADAKSEQSFIDVIPETNEPAFYITQDELEKEIDIIRKCYYNPTSEDSKVFFNNGEAGWNYSREYYFHQGKLVFAFIYNGLEEHRLYFKDGHMIRYIDENMITYDWGPLDSFLDWEKHALAEAAPFETISHEEHAASGQNNDRWLGTWVSADGESLVVTKAEDTLITFTYNGWVADGESMFQTEYVMGFLDLEKTMIAEPEERINTAGWRYVFTLKGDHITMSSRYPDKDFYRQ